MTEKPLVSVIVPTKDSEATISECLESIRNQTYSTIEIVVVDNFSNDSTREIAGEYGARLYLKGPERSSQMNFGVMNALGKYVYIVGSDFVLEPLVIEEAVAKCEDEGCDAVAVHNTSDPSVSFWAQVRKLERDCYKDDELIVSARFLSKKIYNALGGYNEAVIAGEDYDIHNRLLRRGSKVGRIASQEIHVGEPRTLQEIIRKHAYYGKSIGIYIQRNPEEAKKQFCPIRLAYIRNWRTFLRHPLVTVGFGIYQIVRYSAVTMGYLSSLGESY